MQELINGATPATQEEKFTRALKTIDYAHAEIHGGSHFHVTETISLSTATQLYLIEVPNTTKWAHMTFEIISTGEVLEVVTEGADRTTGAAMTELNRDRNSSTAAGLVVKKGATGGSTNGATTIFSVRSGATGQGNKTLSAGGNRASNEWILKQNTKYVVSITSYAAINVSINFDWYEHTNK